MKNNVNNKVIKIFAAALTFCVLMSSLSVLLCFHASAEDTYPSFVDNSESKYFPAIGNQGDQGACCCWAQVYYQFTYMMNRSMDVETTPENTFSHTFIYNFANGGRGQGTWESDVYALMMEIGNVPLSTVPHNIEDYNNWHATEEIWQEAMKYRVKDYTIFDDIGQSDSQITSVNDSDLNNIKSLLVNGEVLAATTYINSWDVERIKAHPDAPENDKYLDQYIVRLCDGAGVRHRVTIVGYNDNIWLDINENNKVDAGEMGAFKVANSWGTERHNKGYMWVAYDAINRTSCVNGCPTVNYRPETLNDITQIEVIPYDSDTDLYIRYTLNTCDRSQGKMYATATKGSEEYTFEIGPKKMHGMQNSKFSYDGTTNVNDGTMVCALSNIVPDITPETLHEYTFSVKFEDNNADGKVFTVKNMEIVDESTGRISKPDNTYPFKLDGTSRTVTFPVFEEYVPVTTTAPATEVSSTAVVTTVVPTATTQIKTDPDETVTTVNASTAITVPSTPVPSVSHTNVTTSYTETSETMTDSIITTDAETTVSTLITDTSASDCVTTARLTTTPKTTETAVYDEYLYGDANNDGTVKIGDATVIQKYIAHLVGDDKLNLTSADCNEDTKVSVKDATCIQKYLAKLSGCGLVGEVYKVEATVPQTTDEPEEETTAAVQFSSSEVFSTELITDPVESSTASATIVTDPVENTTTPVVSTEVTEPLVSTTFASAETEVTSVATTAIPTTVQPTTTNVPTTVTEPVYVVSNVVTFTNSFGWQGTISCYYWSDSDQTMTAWPGTPMQNAGTNDFGETLYTFEVPENATYIIFTNGSSQTVDIPYPGGELKYYPVTPNAEGKYSVENW